MTVSRMLKAQSRKAAVRREIRFQGRVNFLRNMAAIEREIKRGPIK